MIGPRSFVRIAARATLCAFVALVMPTPTLSADPYEIPLILPLTGQLALTGNSVAKALAVLESEVNAKGGIGGRPIKLVISDDQSNPTIDVQIVSGLIAAHAPLMLGPNLGASCAAVNPMVKDGPVEMCFSPGAHPDPGSYVFAAGPSTQDTATVTAHYAKRRGWKRLAILATTDQSGQDGERMLTQVFNSPEADTQIVDVEHFAPSDLTVAAQLTRIKAANPDIIDVWASGTPAATALHGLRDAGIEVPIVTSYSNSTAAQMTAMKDFLPKVLMMSGPVAMLRPDQVPRGPLHDAVSSFYGELESRGIHPDVNQTTAWDSAQIAIAALRKLGTNATAAQVRDYIANLKGFTGITGTFDFRAIPQRGVDWRSAVAVVRWDAARGSFVRLSPIGG